MQLFYNPELTITTDDFTFSQEESRHIIKVLRKKEGDNLHITNGKGLLLIAQIVLANPKRCKATILEKKEQIASKNKLHLAVAPTKLNDRYEWFLEKATEIGISEITPIICENSERKIIKEERMKKVILSAMKQSLQTFLPTFNPAITYKQFITQKHLGDLFIAHCEDGQKSELKDKLTSQENTTILIGPEGDFSPSEIQLAFNNNFIPVSLGTNRLRTETAAIVACTIVNLN